MPSTQLESLSIWNNFNCDLACLTLVAHKNILFVQVCLNALLITELFRFSGNAYLTWYIVFFLCNAFPFKPALSDPQVASLLISSPIKRLYSPPSFFPFGQDSDVPSSHTSTPQKTYLESKCTLLTAIIKVAVGFPK